MGGPLRGGRHPEKLNGALLAAVKAPEVRERLEGLAFEITAAPLRESAEYVRSGIAKWGPRLPD